METDKRSRADVLAEAAKARNDARLLRLAAPLMKDEIHQSLRQRADELETLATVLEARATKMRP